MRLLRLASEAAFGILIGDCQIEIVHQNQIVETIAIEIANHQLRTSAGDFTGVEFRFGPSRRAGDQEKAQ
jgi:hypothetical protein